MRFQLNRKNTISAQHRQQQILSKILPKASLAITPLPLVPQLKLYLLDGKSLHNQFSSDETQKILQHTPFWAFCWASGQALAYTIAQHPQLFKDKRVLDVGSGSGVVAIAAAMSGARRVIACDHDHDAIQAIQINALLNNVEIETVADIETVPDNLDIITAADVLYDTSNIRLLETFEKMAPQIIIADSRYNQMNASVFQRIAKIDCQILPDLDRWEEFNQTTIWQSGRASLLSQATIE